MDFGFFIQYAEGFARVTITGQPVIHQFVCLVHFIAADSRTWTHRNLLVDLRGVSTLVSFTDQFTMGEEAARQLPDLRIASLVPEHRLTRVSEKAAHHSGGQVRVFTSETEALAWLGNFTPAPGPGLPPRSATRSTG